MAKVRALLTGGKNDGHTIEIPELKDKIRVRPYAWQTYDVWSRPEKRRDLLYRLRFVDGVPVQSDRGVFVFDFAR